MKFKDWWTENYSSISMARVFIPEAKEAALLAWFHQKARIDELEATLRSHKVRIGLLEGMIDNGLGWGDIKNDISPIPDMNS